MGLKLELSSGGRAKWNRVQWDIPKTPALNAACVGKVRYLHDWQKPVLKIGCAGRGVHQRSRMDSFRFPRVVLMRSKQVRGFQTGVVIAQGVHCGYMDRPARRSGNRRF